MKLYFHLQTGEGLQTKVIRLEERSNETVASCADKAFPSLTNCYTAHNELNKPLPLHARVRKVLSHMDDVFLERTCQPELGQEVQPSSASFAPENEGINNESVSTASAPLNAVLRLLQDYAASAEAASNYKLASELYGQILLAVPGHTETLEALSRLWLKYAQQPARALPYLEQLTRGQAKDRSGMHEMLGDCQLALGSASKALQSYNQALALAVEGGASVSQQQDLQIAMARAMLAQPEQPALKDMASQLVMNVLEADQSHFGALELYAIIAEEQGLFEDALRVALRLVVTQWQHKSVRALLARRLQAPEGVQALYKELSAEVVGAEQSSTHASRSGTASALAFLASIVKDHGAVAPAVQLLQKAVEYDPLHPGYALSLAHALELTNNLAEVVASVAACLWRLEGAGAKASHLALGGDLSWKAVAAILEGVPPMKAQDPSSWLAWRAFEPWDPRSHTKALANQAQSAVHQVEYSHDQLDMLALCFTAVKVLYIGGAITRAARLVTLLEPARCASKHELHTTLIRNEAAYHGCVYKLLQDNPPPAYGHAGKGQGTAPVVLEPQEGCKQESRDGPMEEALATQGPHAPQQLFFCGDSHCLPAAWRLVTWKGQQRLLHPLLVTGCKVWHLRPDSTFYPKVQFQDVLAHVPDGSQIVLLLGEIDCREGMLMAVQKHKYDSLQEALSAVVDLHVSVLKDLIKSRGFRLYVHPIPPVLEETRPVVKAYVQLLKSKVPAAAASLGVDRCHLQYLDFFERLLSPDGCSLAPGLALDGTHLSPAYLARLSEAFEHMHTRGDTC